MADKKAGWIGGNGDALHHLGITFVGGDSSLRWRNASTQDQKRAQDYLAKRFGVYAYTRTEPFLVLGFNREIAGPGELPYSVGGYVPVWCEDGNLDFDPVYGAMGLAEPQLLDIFAAEKVDYFRGPTPAQILTLANNTFTDAEAFTFISVALIVELPRSDENEFLTRVSQMPVFYEKFP